jgi:pimeloyl-ACP methyl ester carboxylesterase
MAREPVSDPVPFPQAFRETGDAAAQSQAAVLLTIGNLLRYESPRRREAAGMRMAPSPASPVELVPEADREKMNLPRGMGTLWRDRGVRYDAEFVRDSMGRRRGLAMAAPAPEAEREQSLAQLPEIADRFEQEPEPLAAAQLCEASLSSPDELVRVAAAAAYCEIALPDQQARMLEILARGTESGDPLVREVAATALARLVPGHPRLLELMQAGPESGDREPSYTSLLIHGTWARQNDWWQPGFPGNFHDYLHREVAPDLYGAPDRFEWTGGYSDAARQDGALQLAGWVNHHGVDGLDVFAHSHGGNIAMLATRSGMRIGRLVLLSCPVHQPKYDPDFSRVARIFSVRVRMDLVILADGGGQRFHDPHIEEIILPIWFQHPATHEEPVWRKHGVPALIA